MPENEIPSHHPTATAPAEQEAGRGVVLTYATVPLAVKRECDGAMQEFGFSDLPEGYRVLAKLFARSERIRSAVRDEMHLAVLDRPEGSAA